MKSSGYNIAIAVVSIAIVALLAWPHLRSAPTAPTSSGAAQMRPTTPMERRERQSDTTGNRAHDLMMGMTTTARGAAFRKLFAGNTKYPCDDVTRTFYAGMEPRTKNAFWSVACRSGNTYQVTIENDAEGSTRVISCRLLKLVTNLDCFKLLSSQ